MEVIKAHRARVAELKNSLEELMRLEMNFHEICAESWDLQVHYTPETQSNLRKVHSQMEEMAREILTARQRLDPREPATSTDAFPIRTQPRLDPPADPGAMGDAASTAGPGDGVPPATVASFT